MTPSESLLGTRVVSESIHAPVRGETATIAHHLYAGDRSRSELVHPVGTGYEIERRDSRQKIQVFVDKREYRTIPILSLATEEEKARFRRSGRHWRRRFDSLRGTAPRECKITFSYEATGKERLMFGCAAHHWNIRRRDEHDRKYGENWTETITEAWYLDSQHVAARFPGFSAALVHHAFSYATSGERVIIEHSGQKPSGLCAWSETKSLAHLVFPNGEVREHAENSSTRIVSMTEESFSACLFDPPKGFRKIAVYPNWLSMARQDFARLFRMYSRNAA